MEKKPSVLERVPLFRGIRPDELGVMLGCLGARRASYCKQEIVLREGEPVRSVGIVLEGKVQIVKEDFLGNRNILADIEPGNLFAEAYSCVQTERFPLTVVSVAQSTVLWVEYRRIVTTCTSACAFHARLIENMLAIVASKNILLNRKIEHISRRTTREKLMAYLSDQAAQKGSREFDIPFSRQELADYLCVDRSALSAELGRLQREGVLAYRLNHFALPDAGD